MFWTVFGHIFFRRSTAPFTSVSDVKFDNSKMFVKKWRKMPTYGFAYAKVKKSILISKILEIVGNMDIISYNFHCLLQSTI